MGNSKKYKEFHVDYLTLLENNGKIKGEFPFKQYLSVCAKKEVSERKVNYNGEVARLQNIVKIDSNQLSNNLRQKQIWRLDFIRIKKFSMTGVADEEGNYDEYYIAKKLNDKQYLADPTTCLYDADLNVLIIARNRDGILPSGILEFIKKITNKNNLEYGILPTKTTFSKANSNIYRNLSIGINDIDNLREKDKSFLSKKCKSVYAAITSMQPYGSINMRINLSMGNRPKKYGMQNQKINQEIQSLIESGIDNINKLTIGTKADEDVKIEEIDLLQDKIHDKFKVSYSKQDLITHEKLWNYLLMSYDKMYNNVKKIKK